MPSLAFVNDLGSVSEARDFMMIGYDEVYDMQYMHKNYKAYYARDGKTIFQAFEEFRDGYADLMSRCRALDKTIYDDALAAGNVKYAEMLAANYRLVMGAHKLFQDDKGLILYFSKEKQIGRIRQHRRPHLSRMPHLPALQPDPAERHDALHP